MDYTDRGAVIAQLRITDTDIDDATYAIIDSCVTSASRRIDRMCGRRFYADESATARVYDVVDSDILPVDDISTGDLDQITVEVKRGTGDYVTLDNSGHDVYELLPLNPPPYWLTEYPRTDVRLCNLGTYFYFGRANRIRVTALWGACPSGQPEPISRGAAMLGARLVRRRDSIEGIMGFADIAALRLRADDPDVWELIAPYARGDALVGIA